ncbi:unnamed protein product, partial [Prorocentrum cordatum]
AQPCRLGSRTAARVAMPRDALARRGTLHAIENRLKGPGSVSAGIVLPDNTSKKSTTFRPKPSKEEVRELIAGDLRRGFVNHANSFGASFSQPPRVAAEVLDDPWKADRLMSPQRSFSRTQIKYRSQAELFPEVRDTHAARFEKLMASAAASAPPPTRDQLKQLTRMVLAQPHIDMPRMSPKVKSKLTRRASPRL